MIAGGITDLETVIIDVTDGESVRHARDSVLASYPDFDMVVATSGVLLVEDLRGPAHFTQTEATININPLGRIRTVDAFTPI